MRNNSADKPIHTDKKFTSIYMNLEEMKFYIWCLRPLMTETYSIARMFRKFTGNIDRIGNCNENNSLNNIIYFGGFSHVTLINDFMS